MNPGTVGLVFSCIATLISIVMFGVVIRLSWQVEDLEAELDQRTHVPWPPPLPVVEVEAEADEELVEGMEWREFPGPDGETRRLRIKVAP